VLLRLMFCGLIAPPFRKRNANGVAPIAASDRPDDKLREIREGLAPAARRSRISLRSIQAT